MEIKLEEIAAIRSRMSEINKVAFDEITWTRNGSPADIPEQLREDFRFMGLSNFTFPEILGDA